MPNQLLFVTLLILYRAIPISSHSVLRSFSHDRLQQNLNSSSATFTSPGIITIPLIPHRVQRRRHLELARKLEQEQREAGYPARRRRNLADNDEAGHYKAEQVAGLYQGYGTHYADLWCGTPPQRQTVIVDTGSGVTAFPCAECRDCGVPDYHIDPLFSEKESSSFRSLSCNECLRGSCSRNSCTIGQAYQEGSSWTAFEAVDSCYVGGFHNSAVEIPDQNDKDDLNPFDAKLFAFDMKFGCQTKLTGLFKTQLADGIMGMDVAEASYWWQMYSAKKIAQKAFSLCYSRHDEAERSGTEAGAMSLGGTDTRLHTTPMVYSANKNGGSGFYEVTIKKVWLREADGGDSALPTQEGLKHVQISLSEEAINGGRVIVDSGTTDTYFSRQFGVAFKKAWEEITGEPYSHEPLDMSADELTRTQPTILFQLYGDTALNKEIKDASGQSALAGLSNDLDSDNPYDVILAIPPTHYYEYDEEINKYVSRFYVDDSNGGVLGANAMMGHDVYFDVERSRIGWAESKCQYTEMVSKYTDGNMPVSSIPSETQKDDDYDDEVDEEDEGEAKIEDEYDDEVEEEEPTFEDEYDDEVDEDDEGNATFENEFISEVEKTEIDEEYATNPENSSPGGFCSGILCQLGVTLAAVSAVIGVALKLVRKAPSGPNYDLAVGTELELSSNHVKDFDDENFSDMHDRRIKMKS